MNTNEVLTFHNFLIILQGLLLVFVTIKVARMLNRPPILWALLSFVFGIYALFLLVLLPPVKKEAAPLPDEKPSLPSPPDLVIEKKEEAHPEILLAQLSSVDWYFADEKKEVEGPLSLIKMQEFAKEGKLTKDSFVWCELFKEWKKISSDEKLLHIFFGV